MEKVFVFDLDDTLMWNEHNYSRAFIKMYNFLMRLWKNRIPYIGSIAAAAEEISARMIKEINPLTGKPYGFTMERFPTVLVQVYKELCLRGFGLFEKEIADKIYKIGMSTFNKRNYQKAGMVPYAKEVLNFLKEQKDELILMTKGDMRVQDVKIKTLKLKKWFREIYIVEEKTVDIFLKISSYYRNYIFFSVGNSYWSDIEPALKAGYKGIFIPCATWKAEQPPAENYDDSQVFVFQNIKEIKINYAMLK